MNRFGLHSTRVLLPDGLKEATVFIDNGSIESIEAGPLDNNELVEDLGNSVIMPGLIDSHVHINEPGRANWEGFETATKAAAAGGITTLIEMPLNSSPVTTSRAFFEEKQKHTEKKLHVNCGFYGGIVPDNLHELDALLTSGVFGIKAFLTHSGIDDFPNVSEQHLREALPLIKKHQLPLLVHAEIDSPHEDQQMLNRNPRSYQAYLKSRPKSWEDQAIELMINLCEEFDTRIHIVHLSSSNAINPLKQAIDRGVPISVETCTHYLVFNAEDIPDGDTTYKCAPPIREKSNNDQLWKAIDDGLISFIVSDHSPSLPALKEIESGNLKKAWGGIAGLQFGLPAFWTEARKSGFTILDMARLMSENAAAFLNLQHRKGKLMVGYDADLCIWDPNQTFNVKEEIIHHKHKITPYVGSTLHGVVERTYVGGHKVYDQGKFITLSKGQLLLSNHI